ncbi:hypothetical protein WICPIJ_000215 [Wickerhamomyces pijperi]|uniref:Uncharacterized protein n=1 Tax=Wickerhamomyces pijperi TaxID=599730 RepID=A0A9P8TR22_WICPI|nr:hypothetical protein WICPIJ_000215 [Wickerhamomyces pijperi]
MAPATKPTTTPVDNLLAEPGYSWTSTEVELEEEEEELCCSTTVAPEPALVVVAAEAAAVVVVEAFGRVVVRTVGTVKVLVTSPSVVVVTWKRNVDTFWTVGDEVGLDGRRVDNLVTVSVDSGDGRGELHVGSTGGEWAVCGVRCNDTVRSCGDDGGGVSERTGGGVDSFDVVNSCGDDGVRGWKNKRRLGFGTSRRRSCLGFGTSRRRRSCLGFGTSRRRRRRSCLGFADGRRRSSGT